jgi:glycosyltransferase involved in cell wall biosynthesis
VVATLHGFQEAKNYQGIGTLTAVSQAVKKHYVSQGLPANTIEVLYNGHSAELLKRPGATFREQLGIAQDALVLGNMATLTPIKQQYLLLEAAAQLQHLERPVHVIMAGTGPLLDDLRARAKKLGIEQNVHFIGFTVARASFYYALDLYVQTSSEEGFCMPLSEAMACAIPVISTQSRGPEEYITDAQNGIIIKEQSAKAVALAIEAYLASPEKLTRMGAAGRDTVKHWQWPIIAKQYERKFQEVIRCYHA